VCPSSSGGVALGARDLAEESDWVGLHPSAAEYAGSHFWLPVVMRRAATVERSLLRRDTGQAVLRSRGRRAGLIARRDGMPTAAITSNALR